MLRCHIWGNVSLLDKVENGRENDMSNVFAGAASRIRGSTVVVPVYFAFIALLIIGVGLWIEDYNTSYAGYAAFPTRKVGEYVTWLVAALPQVGQIAFFYLYMNDTQKRWSFFTAVLLFIVDIGTDVWYKMDGQVGLLPLAVVESFAIYTIGSEVAVTASFGMLLELFPDVWKATSEFFDRAMGAIEGENNHSGKTRDMARPSTQRRGE